MSLCFNTHGAQALILRLKDYRKDVVHGMMNCPRMKMRLFFTGRWALLANAAATVPLDGGLRFVMSEFHLRYGFGRTSMDPSPEAVYGLMRRLLPLLSEVLP